MSKKTNLIWIIYNKKYCNLIEICTENEEYKWELLTDN